MIDCYCRAAIHGVFARGSFFCGMGRQLEKKKKRGEEKRRKRKGKGKEKGI
jgi:hypothetical protein